MNDDGDAGGKGSADVRPAVPATAHPARRTGASHPLRIDALGAGDAGGCIGITFCPGKKGPGDAGFLWDRDLQLDLDAVAAWKPDAIVTLLEAHECRELGVVDLGDRIRSRGIEWLHLPVPDVQPPGPAFDAGWQAAGPTLNALLRSGGRVLVHCRGGLGRAGTVAARLLVELGASPAEAVRRVRGARPGAIETRGQEDYVRGLTPAASPRAEWPAADEALPVPRPRPTDWFEQLTGFAEGSADQKRRLLKLDGQVLRSLVNGASWAIGRFELVSLEDLRRRVASGTQGRGRTTLRILQGDVRRLHAQPAFAGAVFQVASQFNCLEMVGPRVMPEQGVTRYAFDPTQGPACAMAAGAATIYRNDFVPVGDRPGQTRDRQLDGFAGLGAALATAIGRSPESLWTMSNGYALFIGDAVDRLSAHLRTLDADRLDALRRRLAVGVQWDVEVTEAAGPSRPQVTQAFCSALPVSYNAQVGAHASDWEPLATLVLEAAYEATLAAAVLNAQRGVSNKVLLTLLGGGAFGNDESWILAALQRAIHQAQDRGLEVIVVSYGRPSPGLA